MRVGIDIRCLLDEPRSGVGELAYTFLVGLLHTYPTVTFVLFTSGSRIQRDRAVDLCAQLPRRGTYELVHLLWPNKVLNLLWWIGVGPRIDRLLDVKTVWMSNFNFARFSPHARVVITCHDLSFFYLNHVYSRKGLLWHWFVNPLKWYRRANYIAAVSQHTKQDLIDAGFDANTIKVVYPIIQRLSSTITSTIVRTQYELPAQYWLYIGTLDPRKNILGLIEAFKLYRTEYDGQVDLVIGGRLGWHSRQYYTKLLHLLTHDPHIKYLGYIPQQHKAALYQSAFGFVYPSLYEGFGFPPIEAMQAGTPVIVSNISSLPEVVRGAALLVNPNNITDLAQALKTVESSAKIRAFYTKKGEQVGLFWDTQQVTSVEQLFVLF